jgi:FlaA1/EpsC-like NDP-sugar epimerase
MFSHQRFVLVLGDIVALIASFCVMAVVRFDVGAQGSRIWYQMELFAVLFAVWVIVFFIFELYNLRRINPNPRNIGLLIAAMVINFFLGVLLFYLVPSGGITPKTNLIILIACAFIVLVIWRRIFYLLFTKRFVRRIGIIGTNPLIEHLTRELAAHPHLGTIIGHWNTPEDMTRARAHLVIADNIDPQTLLRLSYDLNTETVSLTEAYETLFAKIPVELMTNQKAIELMTNRTTPAQRAIYRVFEIIIAVLVLIISSPFLLIAIIARYIEDGSPVFYSQTRVGKGGSIFHIYKIRSMKKQAK